MALDAAVNSNAPSPEVDTEKGASPNGDKTAAMDDAPVEPYMKIEAIAQIHPESRINLENIEKSAGLSSSEAANRLITYGKNGLTPPPRTPEWKLLLKQFQNTFLMLLIASGVLSVVAYAIAGDNTNLYLGIVLFVVVFLTGYGQYHEERKAFKIIDSFSLMLAKTCTVFRDGQQQTIEVEDLVPGDLVLVKDGDKVPADMVLLVCRGLKTECASLTGESKPISCSDQASENGTRMTECKNLIFNSSLCFDGMAIGLVVRTGDKTAIGAIAKLASDTELGESTLQKEIRVFVGLIAIVAVTMASIFFTASVFLQEANTSTEIIKLFVNGFLIIIVANVPQGLPSTVISLLSLAARNMAKLSVLVKRLDCVETLGSTSIICSDKTGTLTKNEMTVTDIWYNQRLVRRHRWEAKSLASHEPQALLYRAAILCNRGQPISDVDQDLANESIRESQRQRISNVSRLSWRNSVQQSVLSLHDTGAPKFSGNPSDCALLSYCDRMHSVSNVRQDYPILFEVPFNSKNKWQLVIVKSRESVREEEDNDEVDYEVLMKGAPEVILGKCRTFASNHGVNGESVITAAFKEEFTKTYEDFASKGRRVLALCSRTFKAPEDVVFNTDGDNYNFPTSDLHFIGLVAIMDPPRDNVPEAIAKCHHAGVKVFMVTGDHPLTARAIAKQVGLLQGDNNILLLEDETSKTDWKTCDGAVIHGSRIDELSDEQWKTILLKQGVCFARTTPAHKLLIVKKCQTLLGAVVAVTGDGVNDAPALKQADVGVAMGLNGSAVAQESADILLMDDNFASIVDAIEEGRKIFENIKKTIAYTLAHIFPEVVSAVLSLLGGVPAGLTALQVLTIDLGTELGPAISLAYEKAEADVMERKPRDPARDRLVSPALMLYSYVTSGVIISVGCIMAYWFSYKQNDLRLSDFHAEGVKNGDFFTLTASEPVFIERTKTYYSAAQQRRIFSEGVTAFYITLTVAQFCHIWVCKSRTSSIFVHGFGNKLTFYGVGLGFAMVIFFSYVPGVQDIVGSAIVGWVPWVCALVTGAVLWIYNEGSKWYFRRAKPNDIFVRMFAW